MKKKVLSVLVGCAVCVAGYATAQELRPVSSGEEGHFGATDAIEIGWSNFGGTSVAGVSQTNQFTLSGPCAWSFSAWTLDAPYSDFKQYASNGLATTTNSITFTAAIGSTTLVDGVQVARDAWRPYKSIVPTSLSVSTATNFVSTGTWPYSGVLTNGQTATITVVVGAPGGGVALSALRYGQSRLLFRIIR